ncbi:hypothetical protein CKAN_01180400 [Cinnamomum micranthum f. kanehirae]|uniref:Uncharacterized protein n=1 Tax=Cinnamomum micranthum f. kanehirae TaxID=337451 RepID=A0A3S3N946_9MAGN|nr:hypothetical protein CKAN_01180400 [Cinnamomum micranthum f. kanehirae]
MISQSPLGLKSGQQHLLLEEKTTLNGDELEMIRAVAFVYDGRADHSQKSRRLWHLSSLGSLSYRILPCKFLPPAYNNPINRLSAPKLSKNISNCSLRRERERPLSSTIPKADLNTDSRFEFQA